MTITNVSKRGSEIYVDYKALFDVQSNLNVVMLLKEKVTQVKRGENRNKRLIDTHIVISKKVINNLEIKQVVFKDVNFELEELEFVAYTQNKSLEVTGAYKW